MFSCSLTLSIFLNIFFYTKGQPLRARYVMSSLSIYNLRGRIPGKKRKESYEVDCRESRGSMHILMDEKFRTEIMLDKINEESTRNL